MKYEWKISAFDCTPEKVVTAIHWRYLGTNDNNVSYESYGMIPVGEPNPDNFTDFEKLSFEQVTGWIEDIYSQKTEEQEFTQLQIMQNNIAEQIELIEQPKTITLAPPF